MMIPEMPFLADGVTLKTVEIQTREKVLKGGFFNPDPNVFGKPRTGIVVIHGVQAAWDNGVPLFLASFLAQKGYATLGINCDHAGTSFRTSQIETAIKDVGAAIQFMNRKGFKNIFLTGHSLGTIVVEFYQGKMQDPTVKAIGLYGPHINLPAITRDSLLGPELYSKFLSECRELVAQGKGDELRELPYREGKVIFTSAKTFMSYRDIDTSDAAAEKWVRQLRNPIFLVYDPTDNIQGKGQVTQRESLIAQIQEHAVASPRVDVLVVPPRPGTSALEAHHFLGNEKFVIDATVKWLSNLGLPPLPLEKAVR